VYVPYGLQMGCGSFASIVNKKAHDNKKAYARWRSWTRGGNTSCTFGLYWRFTIGPTEPFGRLDLKDLQRCRHRKE